MKISKSPQRFHKRRGGLEIIRGEKLTIEPGWLNPHAPMWVHSSGRTFVDQQEAHQFCIALATPRVTVVATPPAEATPAEEEKKAA